jgi:ubiquinone biosynthesis protein
MSFEELGPTFVKLGQLLSTRPDLLPEAYIEEFTRLQDSVQPLPFEAIRAVIEKELGRTLEDAYSMVDTTPLAAASIGQVHQAVLKTGEKVVIKIQRPGIDKQIYGDISLLAFIATLLEKYVPETQTVSPVLIVDEFFKTLTYELDFIVEANNMRKMAQNLEEFKDIVIPRVYKTHSTKRILTLERLEGIRLNDIKALDAAGIDRAKLVDVGARAFFKSVMLDGVFHGDLHGGNLFMLPGNKLGIVDFGIVGRLSQKSRDRLANMMMSILSEDFENLCYQYAELSEAGHLVNFEGFQREVRNSLSPYIGLSLGEVNIGRVLMESTKIGSKYHVRMPGEWMLVFKAIVTMEGMATTLDPDFDLIRIGQDLVKDLVRNQYSPTRLGKEVLWLAKDAAALLQVLPRQITWFLRKFTSNDYALEIKSKELADIRVQLDVNGQRVSLSVLCAGLFVASAIALQHGSGQMFLDYPLSAIILFVAAVLTFIRLFSKGL